MTALFAIRFNELEQQLEVVKGSSVEVYNPYIGSSFPQLSSSLLLNWTVKAESLIASICSKGSPYITAFEEAKKPSPIPNNYENALQLEAVFRAVKEDFEGGYLTTLRNLVQAEVFSSELEQASELLSAGYASAAAVIAGVVLETTVRNLCTDHGIAHGKLDKMNSDLAKAGVYNSIQQKRITALAGIRNSAAHGKPEEFTKADVKGMIEDVERFLGTTL